MEPLIVDRIETKGNTTWGYVFTPPLVKRNLETMCSEEEVNNLFDTVKNSKFGQGMFVIRYHQFIVLLSIGLQPPLNVNLVIIDCHNDLGAALDEFTEVWKNRILRDQCMMAFTEIQNNTDLQAAEMIVIAASKWSR